MLVISKHAGNKNNISVHIFSAISARLDSSKFRDVLFMSYIIEYKWKINFQAHL
jgi:hypothetical protein